MKENIWSYRRQKWFTNAPQSIKLIEKMDILQQKSLKYETSLGSDLKNCFSVN